MHGTDTALLRTLWEQMPHLIVLVDGDDRIRTMSPALARQLGFREAEVRGRPIADIARDAAGNPYPGPGATHPWWQGQVIQLVDASGAPLMMRVDRLYEMPDSRGRHWAMSLHPIGESSRNGAARQRELDAIADVSSAVCRALDLESILRSALDKVMEILAMDAGFVGLVDQEEGRLQVIAHRGMERIIAVDPMKVGADTQVINTAILSGQPLLIPDLAKAQISTRARDYGYRAVAAVPIVLRGEPLGVVLVVSPRPREFDDRAEGLLRTMGLQVTIAVEHARLLEQETRRAQQLETAVQELHHRVKNTLETLSAILESARTNDSGELVDRLLQRVEAMAAAHDLMKEGALSDEVDVGELIARVATFAADATNCLCQAHLEVTVDPCVLPGRLATPLALITSELVGNALRHAFTESGGEVKVSLRCGRGKVRLSVADNGTGILRDRMIKGHSTGLLIVRALAEHSLGGTLSVRRRQGTRVTVSFPVPQDALNRRCCLEPGSAAP